MLSKHGSCWAGIREKTAGSHFKWTPETSEQIKETREEQVFNEMGEKFGVDPQGIRDAVEFKRMLKNVPREALEHAFGIAMCAVQAERMIRKFVNDKKDIDFSPPSLESLAEDIRKRSASMLQRGMRLASKDDAGT